MDIEFSIYQQDIEQLYQDKTIEEQSDGTFFCPVCKKSYKRKSSAEKHLHKQSCYQLQDIFGNTITEQNAMDIYQEAMSSLAPKKQCSLHTFRKSREYKPALSLALFCMNNRVKSDLYTQWIMNNFRPKFFNYIKTIGQKDETLRQFRDFLIANEQCIDSEYFFEQNQHRIYNDEVFMIRSLERGDIGIQYLINQFPDFVEYSEHLSNPIKKRLENVMDKAGL